MSRIRRILHRSDFSRASGAAFTKAAEMAKSNHAELLAHVLAPVIPMAGRLPELRLPHATLTAQV